MGLFQVIKRETDKDTQIVVIHSVYLRDTGEALIREEG